LGRFHKPGGGFGLKPKKKRVGLSQRVFNFPGTLVHGIGTRGDFFPWEGRVFPNWTFSLGVWVFSPFFWGKAPWVAFRGFLFKKKLFSLGCGNLVLPLKVFRASGFEPFIKFPLFKLHVPLWVNKGVPSPRCNALTLWDPVHLLELFTIPRFFPRGLTLWGVPKALLVPEGVSRRDFVLSGEVSPLAGLCFQAPLV